MAPKPEVLAIAGSLQSNNSTGLFQRTMAGAADFLTLFQPAIAAVKSWLSTGFPRWTELNSRVSLD
jgi:hypothetical protein